MTHPAAVHDHATMQHGQAAFHAHITLPGRMQGVVRNIGQRRARSSFGLSADIITLHSPPTGIKRLHTSLSGTATSRSTTGRVIAQSGYLSPEWRDWPPLVLPDLAVRHPTELRPFVRPVRVLRPPLVLCSPVWEAARRTILGQNHIIT